jgi:hypothetical protein
VEEPLYKSCLRPGGRGKRLPPPNSQSLREQRDEALEKLRKKYAPKKLTLEERLRKAQQTIEREKEQVKHQTMQTAISVGATILGGVLGRRGISGTSIGRATTTARNASRTMKETQDVGRAKESFEQVKKTASGAGVLV